MLNFRVSIPTAYDVVGWIAVDLCREASPGDWRGAAPIKPSPLSKAQPQMTLLAGFLVELSMVHLPIEQLYGRSEKPLALGRQCISGEVSDHDIDSDCNGGPYFAEACDMVSVDVDDKREHREKVQELPTGASREGSRNHWRSCYH